MNKRTTRTKRIWSMLLAAVLIVSVVTPAVAATARATTMKLEKTEGTVTLKTQNGSSRKPTNGMRLLNGNTLATAASSYAHISLDGTKAVKLDQNSSTTVRQSGKQLELLVKSGLLFFNVSEKLTQKESLNIRTSSMVAGIRGTCGVVEKVNPAVSKLYLIEGQVTLGTGENATTVYGGQTATVILRPKNETGESGGSDGSGTPGNPGSTTEQVEQKVYVDKLTEKAVPVFAITEILSNPVLQQKIEATTELKIEKLKEALAESQKEPGEEEKEEEKKPEETTAPSSGGSFGGSSGGGVNDASSEPGTGGVVEEEVLPESETTLTGEVSAAAINAALKANKTVTLGGSTGVTGDTAGDSMVRLDDNISILDGRTLIVKSAIEAMDGCTITVGNGTLIDTTNCDSNMISDKDTLLCTISDEIRETLASVYGKEFNAQVVAYINDVPQTDGSIYVNVESASSSVTSDLKFMNNVVLKIPQGKTLTVNDDLIIKASQIYNEGIIYGGTIELSNGSSLYNTGGVIIRAIQSEGGATCRNDALIKLEEAYTSEGEDTVSLGSLVSGEKSTALKDAALLAVKSDNSMYCYADNMDLNIVDIMNGGSWTLYKDAVIPLHRDGSGNRIPTVIKNVSMNLGSHMLKVDGYLTFEGKINITGTGSEISRDNNEKINALIYITNNANGTSEDISEDTARITFEGTVNGTITNTSSNNECYVISADEGVLNSTINYWKWIANSLKIVPGTKNIINTIHGIKAIDEYPSNIILKGGSLSFDNGELFLAPNE